MEFPRGTPGPGAREIIGKGATAETIAVVAIYALILAAYGGFVFYESVWHISIPPLGLFFAAVLAAVLWAMKVMWLAVPAALLVLGLVHLHQSACLTWRPTTAWISTVAASVAIGWQNISYFDNWDGHGPYWRALIAAAAQLAAGAAMIAVIAASGRGTPRMTGRGDG